jgi:hypothetical protein
VKRALLELKLFNHQDYEVEFRLVIYLYHGLFRPYLNYLEDKVTIVFFKANRQRLGTDWTFGVLVAE